MTKSRVEEELQSLGTEFILSQDVIAEKLLREIYSSLKHKPVHDLSLVEHRWLSSIENLYQNKHTNHQNRIDYLIQTGQVLIDQRADIDQNERAILRSFIHVLRTSAKNNSLTNFFAEFEKSVEALFRLNFSHETNFPEALELNTNDLLHYVVMTVEMVRERLSQTVVSSKVVKFVLDKISKLGLLVTDKDGIIRFANERMVQLVGSSTDELIGECIKDYVSPDHSLLNAASCVNPKEFEIHQLKVPSANGEVDEWVYIFLQNSSKGEKAERISELKLLVRELSVCDKNDHGEMERLVKTLQSKVDKIEELLSPSSEFKGTGANVKELVDDCLDEVELSKYSNYLTINLKDNILYQGDEMRFKRIVCRLLRCSCDNLSNFTKEPSLALDFECQDSLLKITCSDNGLISSNYSLIQCIREDVEKVQGTFELKSGRTGNRFRISLPL